MKASHRALKIVTSHPGNQVVTYDIAAQLVDRGCLTRHLAAVYYVPTRSPYNLAAYVPGDTGCHLREQLIKRRTDAVPDALVVDFPGVELATRALAATPGLRSVLRHSGVRAIDTAHDAFAASWIRRHRGADIVMPSQGSALRTLRAARDVGAHSVLHVTHPLSHNRIVAAEYRKLGGTAPPPLPPRLYREIETADYLLTASALTTESLLEMGIPERRIKEVPYGIDMTGYDRHEVPRALANEVRFLFVGKLSIHKGLHVLRDAWSTMAGSGLTLRLVGRPTGALEEEIVSTWRDDRVHVVPEVAIISAEYQSADVFVFPSFVEGFGMVTLEAMASGLPVIVTDHSKGVVRHGVDGFVLRPGDADALAHCMRELAAHPDLRAEMSRNARARASQFTWDRFGSDLCAWLTTVVPPIRRP